MKINKLLNDHAGMTLIELLGAISLMIMLVALAFPILFGGMNTVRDIQRETMLRDEADYLMTSIFLELYTTKESDVKKPLNFPAPGTSNYFFTFNNGSKTGFINNEVLINNKKISTSNRNVSLLPSRIISLGDGNYRIELKLKYEGRRSTQMEFVNDIKTINDIEKEDEDI